MKDLAFMSNEKIFREAEKVRRDIRQEIHSKCRNNGPDGPSAKCSESAPVSRNKRR